MSGQLAGYLGDVLVHQHVPARPGGGAVVVIPPYGWDEAASYRSRRALADDLAAQGHLVVRLDLPGTGDSGGRLEDPDRIHGWQRAVDDLVAALRANGAVSVAAVGLGTGGLLAARADVDALVLWGAAARGRTLVRELRAFSRLEQGNAPHDDGLWVYGGLLTTDALRELEAVDLPATAPAGRLRRALVMGRDGIVDDELASWLTAAGVEVTRDAGRGWADLMVEPHRSRPPLQALRTVVDWVGVVPAPDRPMAPLALASELAGAGYRERVVALDVGAGRVVPGVLATPDSATDLTVVLLNAGALPRRGPHRAWTDAARRWAADGVASVRLDLPGIGDADGTPPSEEDLYGSEYVDLLPALLDAVHAQTPNRIALMGLCSGAYWSFQAAQVDPRVAHVVLVNPKALEWHATRAPVAASRELRKVLHPARWRKAVTGQVHLAALREPVRAALRRTWQLPVELRIRWRGRRLRRQGRDPVVVGLDRLAEGGTGVTLVFTAQESLRAELEHAGLLDTIGAHPGVALHLLDGPVETHTLAPLAVRTWVDGVVDAALAGLEQPRRA